MATTTSTRRRRAPKGPKAEAAPEATVTEIAPATMAEVEEAVKATPVRVNPELPAPDLTVPSMLSLFGLKRQELLANMQALSIGEEYDRDELRAMTVGQLQEVVRDAVRRVDHELETISASGEEAHIRTKGDIDRYFGFGELPKGYWAISPASFIVRPRTPKDA